MEAISQWAASLCFAAAAGGLCQMLAPDSGLGRVLKLSISVFFLCSLLLPLGALELDFRMFCKHHSRKNRMSFPKRSHKR